MPVWINEWIRLHLEFLARALWPMVAVIFIAVFRNSLKELFARITAISLKDQSIRFRESSADEKQLIEAISVPGAAVGERWNLVDDVYWLGHDLMLGIDAVLRGAQKKEIVFATNHALLHLRKVGFHQFDSRLARLNQKAEDSLESDWTREARDGFARDLRTLIGEIGDYIRVEREKRDRTWANDT